MKILLFLFRSFVIILAVLAGGYFGCGKPSPMDGIYRMEFHAMDGESIFPEKGKATVFIFLSPDCPIAQKQTKKLEELYLESSKSGIEFYGVFPGFLAKKASAKTFQEDYGLSFALLADEDFELTGLFGATISPEVFVIDDKAALRYRGQIDNWFFDLGKKRSVTTEHYLRDALHAVLNDEVVKVKRTKSVGCFLPKKGN